MKSKKNKKKKSAGQLLREELAATAPPEPHVVFTDEDEEEGDGSDPFELTSWGRKILRLPAEDSNALRTYRTSSEALKISWGRPAYRLRSLAVRRGMSEGLDVIEIAERMGLAQSEVKVLVADIIKQEKSFGGLAAQTTDDAYIKLCIQYEAIARDLLDIQRDKDVYPKERIAAAKERASIMEKMFKLGQDANILERAPRKVVSVHGTFSELHEAGRKGEQEFEAMKREYGVQGFNGAPFWEAPLDKAKELPAGVVEAAKETRKKKKLKKSREKSVLEQAAGKRKKVVV